MKFTERFSRLFCALVFLTSSGCLQGGSSTNSSSTPLPPVAGLTNGTSIPTPTGTNVMLMTVNGSNCAANSYPNKPCVSVTLCNSAGSNCHTVNDLLLDTGSYGLRIFKDALDTNGAAVSTLLNTLSPVTNGSNQVAECVQYGDGTKHWGPVKLAKLTLGGESPVQVPIQVIDSTFPTGSSTPSQCSGAVSSVSAAGMNGILGVGLFQYDCGQGCAMSANNGSYYACNTTTGVCSGSTVMESNQVQNPIASLSQDNNGVLIQLPDIQGNEATSINGYVVFGIGTRANNTPSGVNTYFADTSFGEISTSFKSNTYSSFIDSGSNSFAFPSSGAGLADCGGNATGWFCPGSAVLFNAVNTSSSTSTNGTVQFYIGNFLGFYNSPNNVSNDIGATSGSGIGGLFDWGLPFYFGRNVYHGIEGKSSALGAGPYWAY